MQGQAEKLSKRKKKFLATTYQDFFSALYFQFHAQSPLVTFCISKVKTSHCARFSTERKTVTYINVIISTGWGWWSWTGLG